jgi:hypothetical protein
VNERPQNGRQGYWRRLSDAELLSIRFTVDDPEAVEHLVLDVPTEGDDEPRVEFAYDFRGSKRAFKVI